jgi:5-methylthioadenosine/S-adenosylhomocysteine deaminase
MNPERILLRCRMLIVDASEEPLYDAAALLEDGRVESVGRYPALRRSYPLAPEYGEGALLAMPGLVDAHSHGRGISTIEQGIADAPLEVWLARLTAATALDPYDQALVAAADLLATGVTSAQIFFHSFSGVEDYSTELAATANGLKEGGIGFDLVLGISDQHEFMPPLNTELPDPDGLIRSLSSPERGMDPVTFFELFDALSGLEGRASIKKAREALGGTRPILGPIAPQWSSEAILDGLADRWPRGVRVHTHLLERASQRSSLYGPSPVQKLDDYGLLSDRISVAHGVWLESEEISLLAARKVAVIHCPGSNTRLEAGAAPVREMLDAGVPVALGLDSNPVHHPPDVFAEMRHAREVAASLGTSISEREVLAMATSGGAAAVGRQGEIGTLRPGARADLILLDPFALSEADDDPVSRIINGVSRRDLREVWVGGRALFRDGRLRDSSGVATARGHLHAGLLRDAARRRERLRKLGELEPMLREMWEDGCRHGAGIQRIERRKS